MLAVGGSLLPPLPPLRGERVGVRGVWARRGTEPRPDPAGLNPPHPHPLPPKRGERGKSSRGGRLPETITAPRMAGGYEYITTGPGCSCHIPNECTPGSPNRPQIDNGLKPVIITLCLSRPVYRSARGTNHLVRHSVPPGRGVGRDEPAARPLPRSSPSANPVGVWKGGPHLPRTLRGTPATLTALGTCRPGPVGLWPSPVRPRWHWGGAHVVPVRPGPPAGLGRRSPAI